MAHVATTSNYNAAGASTAVSAPAGIADGDILVCSGLSYRGAGAGAFTWPSGFTEIGQRTVGTGYKIGLAWKRCSSESGTYTVAGASVEAIIGIVGAYRGRLASDSPVDVTSDTTYTTSNTTVRAAAATIATAGSDLIWVGFGYYSDADELTVPSGMTARADVFDGYECLAQADLLAQGAGTTGDKDGAMAHSTTVKHAYMVALKPEAAGLSIPLLNHLLLGD